MSHSIIYVGGGFQILEQTVDTLVLTDAPKHLIGRALSVCEQQQLPFINCYGWLQKGKFHGEKAIWPFLRILDAIKPERVLDPFMGSGTTGLACLQLDIDFIGVECNEPRAHYAFHRLQNAAAGTDTVEFRQLPENGDETLSL